MAALREWVRSLVMLLIFASILELLLPMNGMKRYVRMAMGLIIILGVVKPIVGLLGHPVVVDPTSLVGSETSLPTMNQIMADADRFRQKNQVLMLQEAERRLTEEVRSAARRVDGVSDAQVALRIATDGSVEGVAVTVLLGSRYGQVRPVKPVRVPPGAGGGSAEEQGTEVSAEREARLAEAVRREVAAQLGLSDGRLIQVLVDREGQPRR